ncbi:hypothetical protein MKEN_00759200 [Mycena kentingensis (nom. inval.)]|nr:hypothetical protein MKEN_00759200 [Mycena kentingensis (nom. inval.)]
MTSTPASSVLRVQELVDTIALHLLPSIWDLRNLSLVAKSCTASCQRLLFRNIILNRGAFDIDHASALESDDEAGKAHRLAEVLQGSPHLCVYVRRLRLAFEPGVLEALSALPFANLREVVLHRRGGGAITAEAIRLAASLVALPSLERVGLIYAIFTTMRDIAALFAGAHPGLTAITLMDVNVVDPTDLDVEGAKRTVVRKLYAEDSHYRYDQSWLLNPNAPFDLSRVEELAYGRRLNQTASQLLKAVEKTLVRVTVDAQYAVDISYANNAKNPALLASFPRLKHVIITSTAPGLRDVATLLSAVSPPTLETVTIVFDPGMSRGRADAGLERLRELFTSGWESCEVRFVIPKARLEGEKGVVLKAKVESVFAGKLWIGSSM